MNQPFFRRMAVHRKLITLLMVTSGAALLLAALMTIVYGYFQARREAAGSLQASARLILANTRSSIDFDDRVDAESVLATLQSSPEVRLACLYRPSKHLFAEYRPRPDASCPAAPGAEGHRFSPTRLELVEQDSIPSASGHWLLLVTDLNLLAARLRTQAIVSVFVFLVAFLVALLLSRSLQRIVSRPIVELASLAQTVSTTGDYSHRAIKRSDDELGVLAESMNGMLERITRVEAEREMALGREREANRTKDEFLATLSHELRTPLSAILGWTQLLRKGAVAPDEAAGALERIERNALTQTRLIEDLLDVSRILTGKLSLQPHPVDLAPIIRAAVESMRPLAQARHVTLELRIEGDRMLALVDADRISQVVNNLLSNALKFTPARGSVTLTLQRVGDMQQLSVADTGVGISPDFMPRIFEPFRQADSSHSRSHGGLGLGLAIVKRLTEMHGGDVAVTSDGPGRGSSFVVRLPAAVAVPEIGGNADRRRHADLTGVRILVVDDDRDMRELVSRNLVHRGGRVETAGSGAEGISMALANPPDVLITDLAMPQQDGYAMVEQLRGLLGDRMPKVVLALTAFAAQKDMDRTYASGFDLHITKPFDPDLLATAISDRLLARNRPG